MTLQRPLAAVLQPFSNNPIHWPPLHLSCWFSSWTHRKCHVRFISSLRSAPNHHISSTASDSNHTASLPANKLATCPAVYSERWSFWSYQETSHVEYLKMRQKKKDDCRLVPGVFLRMTNDTCQKGFPLSSDYEEIVPGWQCSLQTHQQQLRTPISSTMAPVSPSQCMPNRPCCTCTHMCTPMGNHTHTPILLP